MGFALAARAAARGWSSLLVAGPVHLPTPAGVERVDVVSAAEMYAAVASRAGECDVAIHAAAVADFRPAHPASEKIKKGGHDGLTLELVRTRDILGSMRSEIGFTGVLVGFAAETSNLVEEAEKKYHAKGCDLLVANDVSRSDIGFGSDFNEVLLVSPAGPPEPLPRASKETIADSILDRVEEMIRRKK